MAATSLSKLIEELGDPVESGFIIINSGWSVPSNQLYKYTVTWGFPDGSYVTE